MEEANNRLSKKIITTQSQLSNDVVRVLKDLEVDADGYIKQTIANRKILQKASQAFESGLKNSPYFGALKKYVGVIPDINSANGEYFDFISQGYKPNAQYIAGLKRQTITELETLLLNEGLESQIKAPLVNIMNQNVNTASRFTDMLDQVREYIVGNSEVDGRLLSYSKQITTDALFNYSRAYQQAVTSDLGLEWYYYSGGLTRESKFSGGSRDFCITRVDRYFHHSEIESWAGLTWAGQRRGTTASTIFIYAGGYNCKHSIIPVSNSAVPKSSLKRIN